MSENLPLLFSHQHHLLTIQDYSGQPDVLAFDGEESLSQPFHYRIEFTSADHAITPQMMLRKSASLTLQSLVKQWNGKTIAEPLRVIQGIVSGFERLGSSRDESHYALTLEPRLALLSRSHQNAIYQDMSVPQIVEKILRERHGMRGQDFLFSLIAEYPRREQVMQYGEDDLRFISRLLAEVGIWFRFTADTRLHIDVVEFCDRQPAYERGLTLPAVPLSGQHAQGQDAVWQMASHHRVVEKLVSHDDYNYRDAEEDMTIAVNASHSSEVTTYGEAYHYAEDYLTPGSHYQHFPQVESGSFYARMRHERYLNDQTRTQARTSCPALAPGKVVMVSGGSEVPDVFAAGVVITSLHTSARRDRDFETEFTGIPDQPYYCFRPPLIPRPVMAGTLPARVTSTKQNDIYGHIDKYGRYRVRMLFDHATWDAGSESMWLRQSRQYAGDTYGLHLPLLAGTEVAIAFEDGDPDRPYIAGALHDSAHPDLVTIHNYRRNVLRTPANNKIRLSDDRGKEHIKISTEYGGKSQLNLGHLVDNEKQQRGEGFELRTDSWGVIRAGKGLFITADGQPKAQGKVREMQPAISNLAAAREQMTDISNDAQTATANPADLQAQIKLLEQQVAELKKSVLLMSAPEGMALSSGEHLQLSARSNLIATAGKSADISVVKNLFIGVGNALSVFVRKLGIKLIANQGPVQLQAQNDLMALLARKEISLISTENEIKIIAKKKITLNGGGSYITLDSNAVEVATMGDYRTRAANYSRSETAATKITFPPLPVLEPGEQSLRFAFPGADSAVQSMSWMVGQPYTISDSDGKILASGKIDNSGRLPVIKKEENDTLKLIIGKETWKSTLLENPVTTEQHECYQDDNDLESTEEITDDDTGAPLTESMIARLLNLPKRS